ncbi:MAG TPA: hypothetical protein VIB48_01250 [Acidimicrobiia bacterium]
MHAPAGPLLGADEYFVHQTVDTLARVAQTDRAWTEKVCAMAAARDGSVQLSFGIGKYTNRNVMDAYAGMSRGVEQWTVRASRQLAPDPETTTVGPLRYEILDVAPRRRIRFALDRNDVLPIAFEWVFESPVPPALEEREVHVSRDRYRLDADVLRFHQSGVARGWFELDGVRTELDESTWVSTRDRSWGVRYGVGAPVDDVAPTPMPPGVTSYVLWFPAFCTRPDGSAYGLHLYYQRFAGPGFERRTFEGAMEHEDGSRRPFRHAVPDLRFDDRTRRFLGGTVTVADPDGERRLSLTPVSATGFHLATGLYGGFDGRSHGQWRGRLHVEGEHIADCTAPDAVARVRQHRQALVRVDDPVGGGVGFGDLQSIVTGTHPEIGLSDAGAPM